MQQRTSRFNAQEVSYKDTRSAGSVTVRGFELFADEDGYIYGPPNIEEDIKPHGFVRQEKTMAAKAQPQQKQPQQGRL